MKFTKRLILGSAMLVLFLVSGLFFSTAAAASEPFLAQVKPSGIFFVERGWAACDGQLLPIAQHSALFSLLGTTYGGDGRSTFALPDLRGRVPIHKGFGPGLTLKRLGERGGEESVTLSSSQIPRHAHDLEENIAYSGRGNSDSPSGTVLARARRNNQYSTAAPDVKMDLLYLKPTADQAHNNMSPYLTLRYVIAIVGIFPSQS